MVFPLSSGYNYRGDMVFKRGTVCHCRLESNKTVKLVYLESLSLPKPAELDHGSPKTIVYINDLSIF